VIRQSETLFESATRNFSIVSECAKNVIKGNVPLTDRQLERLRRSRNDEKRLESIVFEKDVIFCEESVASCRRAVSRRSIAACDGNSVWFTSEIMQAAKKLLLVDEFDREYKRLQRPAVAVVKTDRSLQPFDTLHSQSIADDQKVRQYVAALHRYLNTHLHRPASKKVA